jgi:hypothetical protein
VSDKKVLEIPTFMPYDAKFNNEAGSYGSVKIPSKITAYEKGHFDSKQQDWRVIVIFENGQRIHSAWWWKSL